MCEPISASTAMYMALAASAVSTGVSYMNAKKTAEDTAEYNQKTVDANAAAANKAYISNTQQEQSRMIEEEASFSNTAQQVGQERQIAIGKALASSTALGTNTEYLFSDFMRQDGNQIGALRTQWSWKEAQSASNMKGYEAQAHNRIASVNPAPVTGPSLVGALAGFGTQASSIYSGYRKSLKEQ